METLWNFQGNFWKNLRKIVRKLQIILEKNSSGTPKKFWKYLGRCWKPVLGRFKAYTSPV